VLSQKGFNADTIAALLHNPKLQEQLQDNVLLVDEAGMCGVKTMSQILSLAQKHNTRVILSGDTLQHGPPGQYGDALRILQDQAKLKTASVQKIVRQKPKEYREAVELLGKGHTLDGYKALDKLKAIIEITDNDERLNTVANDYLSSVTSNRSALIISPTHIEGNMLTQIVREKLKSIKRIEGKERDFETLKSLSLTEAQKKDLNSYQQNQIIRFTRNQKGGYKAGEHYKILPTKKQEERVIQNLNTGEVLKLPYRQPEHFQVYQPKQTSIAKGDLIRLTNNSKTLENTKVNNGTTYEIAGFTKTGDIKLSSGKTLGKDILHFRHGYVDTSFSSQGKDSKDVFVLQSDISFPASNEQQFYVSVSRGTHSVKVYTSDKTALKNAISRSGERTTAHEIADGHKQRMLQQNQRAHHKTLNGKIRQYGRLEKREKPASRDISNQRQNHQWRE